METLFRRWFGQPKFTIVQYNQMTNYTRKHISKYVEKHMDADFYLDTLQNLVSTLTSNIIPYINDDIGNESLFDQLGNSHDAAIELWDVYVSELEEKNKTPYIQKITRFVHNDMIDEDEDDEDDEDECIDSE